MFNHNGAVLDKKADLLFAMADQVGRGEVSKGQKHGKVHSHHACLDLDEDEWNMEGSQNKCCASNQFTSSALHIGVYGFPVHHNPVWKQMCEVRRYESVVETIPGMELEEVNCKLTENTKAKPKDGTVTENL